MSCPFPGITLQAPIRSGSEGTVYAATQRVVATSGPAGRAGDASSSRATVTTTTTTSTPVVVKVTRPSALMPFPSIDFLASLPKHNHLATPTAVTHANGANYELMPRFAHDAFDAVAPAPFTEDRVKDLTRQLLTGLGALHAAGIAHMDIKLENMLMRDDGSVALADFGLCLSGGAAKSVKERRGSRMYLAPELDGIHGADGMKCDVWSVGVVVCFMLTHEGAIEWQGTTIMPTNMSHLSKECRDWLSKALSVFPSSRASVDELLAHPWLREAEGKSVQPMSPSAGSPSCGGANGGAEGVEEGPGCSTAVCAGPGLRISAPVDVEDAETEDEEEDDDDDDSGTVAVEAMSDIEDA